MDILQKEFDKFAFDCFGNISPQQYTDLRRTFFGGAVALWGHVIVNLSDGMNATPGDVSMLLSIHKEMREFNEAVKRGEK